LKQNGFKFVRNYKGGDGMSNEALYFSDNFFSAGVTDIYNSSKEKVGQLDLKSAFSASLDVIDEAGHLVISGKLSFWGNSWVILDNVGNEIGVLKAKFSFFSKKYEYNSHGRGFYRIESEPFSTLYEIYNEDSAEVGRFEKISGFFSSPAFKLTSDVKQLSSYECVAIVMGINAIQKRNRNAVNGGGGA
jgi:hypothetical protein